jgi:hypothetical protein
LPATGRRVADRAAQRIALSVVAGWVVLAASPVPFRPRWTLDARWVHVQVAAVHARWPCRRTCARHSTLIWLYLYSYRRFAWLSLRTNQPPTNSQQYFSLRINQHQLSATSQTNRLLELTESTVVVILSPSKIKKCRASCPNGKSLFCGPLSVFERLTCELHHPTAEGLIHTDASSEIKLGSGDV